MASAASAKTAAPKRAPATRDKRNSQALAGARAAQRAGAAPATRTAPARRKSGAVAAPARPAKSTRPSRSRTVAAPASSPVARVLNGRGMPLVDRLLRGRAWVAVVGALLAGIVFLNVSVLELNRGIARTDAKAAVLERSNSGLRERVARLDSGERIQQLAAKAGFVMPQPGDVTYVRPRGQSDAKLAATRITAPTATATAAPTATTTPAPTASQTTTATPTTAAPSTTQAAPTTSQPVTQPTAAGTAAGTTTTAP